MQQRIELVNGKFVVKSNINEVIPKEKPIVKQQYSKEVLERKERVVKGNQKLYDAWKKICELDHESQEWKDELERWHQATKKLSILCSNLQGLGYEDCLYLDENNERNKNCLSNPDGFWCQVCPSKIEYWLEDARNLPNAEIKGGKNEEP